MAKEHSGHDVVLVPPASLWTAAELLVKQLGPERLRKLDIRAGEHLAAILTTCFLRREPIDVDTAGGLDLIFEASRDDQPWTRTWLSSKPPVFEVKSLPGPFRAVDAGVNRVIRTGINPSEMGISVQFRTARDILDDVRLQVYRARQQLERKADRASVALNAFIIVHPFDHLSVEFVSEAILGPSLRPLNDLGDLDAVWVLWAPAHLTLWSRTAGCWLNLVYTAFSSPDEAQHLLGGQGDVLQAVEQYFLTRIGRDSMDSPYLFDLRASDRSTK